MNCKLAPAKKLGKKERAEERARNWRRVNAILKMVRRGTATDLDIWWTRKIIANILAKPLVKNVFGILYEDPEDSVGRNVYDQSGTAHQILRRLDRLYPLPVNGKPKRRKKVKETRKNAVFLRAVRKTIRKVQKDIRELRPKAEWWERKLARTSIREGKKWIEIRDRTEVFRKQLLLMEQRVERLQISISKQETK